MEIASIVRIIAGALFVAVLLFFMRRRRSETD